jgi:hypothetical protein
MYSGTTLTRASGRLAGAHQKIDRIARRHLQALSDQSSDFPSIKTILHFEGRNGPDAIKRKSPAKDEPWHYLSPFDDDDTVLLELIQDHYRNLVKALAAKDDVVAGFEAAWLAHAVVDGLTPAHHYPYEEKLDELRGGLGKESRVSYREKVLMPGSNNRETIANNWKMWGPKGLLSTHFAFEWGVSSILLPMRVGKRTTPSDSETQAVKQTAVSEYFLELAREVAAYGLYDEFYKKGWTAKLARTVRQQLVPTIVKAVTLIWYKALCEAEALQVQQPAIPAKRGV